MIEFPKSCVRCRCSKIRVTQRKLVFIECSNCSLMVTRMTYPEAVKAWNDYKLDSFVVSKDRTESISVKGESPDGT